MPAGLTAAHASRLDGARGEGEYLDRYLAESGARYRVAVVERADAWDVEYRRNGKDDERMADMAEAMTQAGGILPCSTAWHPTPMRPERNSTTRANPRKKRHKFPDGL